MTSVGSTGSTTSTTPTTTTTTPSSSVTQTATGAGLQSIGGLATGLDTNSIIAALVAAQAQLQAPYQQQVQLNQIRIQSYGLIQSGLTSLSTAALALNSASDWQALSATSSNTNVATVTAGNGNFGGTLSFTVNNLAAAGTVRSANTLGSTSAAVTSAPAIFVAAGGGNIGFSTFTSDSNVAVGAHTIAVTQASSAAIKNGGTPLAGSTIIDNTNDTLNVTVNGNPQTITLAHGTYTAAQLAQAVQAAANSGGVAVNATLNGSGTLQLATQREGSLATLQVTGGNALTALGLSTDGSALTGGDGKVTVDGGAAQTFNSIDPNQSLVLNAAAGTITAVASGGLRIGTVTGNNVSTGDGSLATVVANINAVGAGVTASAIQVGANSYRLQIASNTLGAHNGENIDGSVFNGSVGGLVTLTAAADADVTVGSGPGAYDVTSSNNSVTGLLPGVTVNLVSQSTSPVTITVNHDVDGLATKVQAMVDAANSVRTTINGLIQFDPTTNQASPLTGDSSSEQILQNLTNAFINPVKGATTQSPGLAGVSIDKTGAFTFDKNAFEAAYNANPTAVQALFTQGGTPDNAGVSFVSAGDFASGGSYDINVTQAAAQATTTGLTSFPPAGNPTITVNVNGTSVSYQVQNGDTRASVAAALNAAFAGSKLALQATDTGSGLQINSVQYGSAANFSVDWGDGNGPSTFTGQDVQGTIGGKAAQGFGQELIVPFSDTSIPGLAVLVKTTQIGDLGNINYNPGIAQRVQTATTFANDPVSGMIQAQINSLNAQIKTTNQTISDMQDRVNQYETMLRAEFANLESVIGTLKNQSNWLGSTVNVLGGGSSSSSSSGSSSG